MKRALRPFAATAFLAALLLGAFASAATAEEKSLLAADGTLYEVRAGLAADLGIAGSDLEPDDFVIEWAARRQDGTIRMLVPDSGQ